MFQFKTTLQFILFLLIFPSLTSAASVRQSEECLTAETLFWNRFERLQKNYAKLNQPIVDDLNKPSWTWGRKKAAVYLLHGFIGTPEEMSEVSNLLADQNFTIINDIIPGHGSNGFLANHYNEKKWIPHVKQNLNQLRNCFDEIHLIGFSTGALLIHDYLRQNPEFNPHSVTFYSPFYRPHIEFGQFLLKATQIITPVVYTKAIYAATHFPDIRVAVLKPDHYMQELPLKMASAVQNLGRQVYHDSFERPLNNESIPFLVFISRFDKIMNYEATVEVMNNDFLNTEFISYENQYAPHHLMVSAVHKNSIDVYRKTLNFILSHR